MTDTHLHIHPVAALHIRDADAADEPFFAALYRSTRPDLLGMLADRRYIDGLVATQRQAQIAHYRARHPEARYRVLVLDGEPAGRLVTADADGALRVVDIAVMPSARGRGVASETLRRLQGQAEREGRALTLAVRADNHGARRLYAALGFTSGEGGDHAVLQLRWRPGAHPVQSGSLLDEGLAP